MSVPVHRRAAAAPRDRQAGSATGSLHHLQRSECTCCCRHPSCPSCGAQPRWQKGTVSQGCSDLGAFAAQHRSRPPAGSVAALVVGVGSSSDSRLLRTAPHWLPLWLGRAASPLGASVPAVLFYAAPLHPGDCDGCSSTPRCSYRLPCAHGSARSRLSAVPLTCLAVPLTRPADHAPVFPAVPAHYAPVRSRACRPAALPDSIAHPHNPRILPHHPRTHSPTHTLTLSPTPFVATLPPRARRPRQCDGPRHARVSPGGARGADVCHPRREPRTHGEPPLGAPHHGRLRDL